LITNGETGHEVFIQRSSRLLELLFDDGRIVHRAYLGGNAEAQMTPAQLASANAEHSHQRAFFAWANMAERFGFDAAWDETSYTAAGMAKLKASTNDRGCGTVFVDDDAEGPNAVPELRWLHAIPNGGMRDKITAGKLKAEGVKRGIPDAFLPVPMPLGGPSQWSIRYCGLYIEMKRPKSKGRQAGSTSNEQDSAIAALRCAGYAVTVCFDWIAAARDVQSYIEAVRNSGTPQK
jgi:hypothetical protein